MARRPLGADDLAHLSRPKARDHRRPHEKREQQRRDRGPGGAKADVVEKVENDVRLAERREPVIEHRASASEGRAVRERRKYTFEGYPTGCLEHHHLAALETPRDQRTERQGIRGGHETVA